MEVFRSLANYKEMHAKKHPEVLRARTLTQARILAFGSKDRERAERKATNTCSSSPSSKPHYPRGSNKWR